MNVRCKFYVTRITHHNIYAPPGQPAKFAAEIALAPIWEQDGVNRKWSEATPTGEIKMTITNEDSIAAFELGKYYFVDFSPAEDAK